MNATGLVLSQACASRRAEDAALQQPVGASGARSSGRTQTLIYGLHSLLESTASSMVARKLGQCWAGRR